jgi:hypothetical protein
MSKTSKETKTQNNKPATRKDLFIMSAMAVLIIIACALFGARMNEANTLPSAQTLMQYVEIPEIPETLNRDVINGFLDKERSYTLDAHIKLHYVYSANQTTWDYTVENPFVGTLDVCRLSDGRSVINVGGIMDTSVSGPYMNDMSDHMEKSYVAILNPDLSDADIFMRENNYSISVNEAGEEIRDGDETGQWQFVNDKAMDIDSFISAYNEDHIVSADELNDYGNGESHDRLTMAESFGALKDLVAAGSKVSRGDYQGTECIVLENDMDFSDPETKAAASGIFKYLEQSNDTFYHWNLSQFVEYYGDYTVIKLSLYFLDNGDGTYELFVARADLSECRVIEHFADRMGIKLSDMEERMTFDVEEMYADLIILPYVPDDIRGNMEILADYADGRVEEIQTEGLQDGHDHDEDE